MTDPLERRIPSLAREAFSKAYAETLHAGRCVLVRSGRHLVRVHPSGRRERVKTLEPEIRVTKGARFELD